MTRPYRKFPVAARIAIVARASDGSFRVHCELCGRWCKSRKDYQIDHVIPEGMRPLEDLKRALTPADGQLLCLDCHDKKTDRDKARIALAVRREAYQLGIERPDKKKMRSRPRETKPPYRPGAGSPRLLREGFIPAGGRR